MDAEELRAEIRRLGPWHHDVEVAPGIRTGEVTKDVAYPSTFGTASLIPPDRILAEVVGDIFPEGLNGRSILDCACNAGGYLFAAARAGASRGFGFDVREHWIEQARFLARHVPSDGLEFATLDIHDLPSRKLEPFDVTLFMGIFYHLPDPVASLRAAADLTREVLVLNTAYRPAAGSSLAVNYESETEVMSGVHGLAWLPSGDGVLRGILRWCGFPHARVRYRRRAEAPRFDRIEMIAAREERTLAYFDATRPPEPAPAPPPGLIRRLLGRR